MNVIYLRKRTVIKIARWVWVASAILIVLVLSSDLLYR